ncbi:MAG: hypothetical protein C0469_03370 [Cyanobacteria bacterium DS2.3.42]|nr:hypothetical protein [Cyanobacteria bacterium DS2.3.42]
MNNSKPGGRVFGRRTQVIAVVTSLLLSSIALAALAEEKSENPAKGTQVNDTKEKQANAAASSNEDVASVFAEVETLVKEFYPKAKIVRSEDKLHFEYKARGLAGTQSGLKELSPDSGGVAGDIVVKPGKYTGKERQPSETNLILHMVYFIAPYSEPQNHHFFTRLSYPPDASVDFLTKFKSIVGDLQKGNQEIAVKPAAATAPNTTPPAVSISTVSSPVSSTVSSVQTTADGAARKPDKEPAAVDSTGAPADKPGSKELTPAKVSFGARKLSKYSYPEGRFKVLLPGNPQMKYSNQLGMRSVDYSYPETHGAYIMSYLIAPGNIIESKISPLLDAVCTNISKTSKSVEVRRNSISLQGYQGRQIELAPPTSKDQLARFRLYVVRRFIYIIGAAGNKAWIESPVVSDYLNSLEVVPELSASEARAAQFSSPFSSGSSSDRRESEERAAKMHRDFEEARAKSRKDFERSRADFKFHRY